MSKRDPYLFLDDDILEAIFRIEEYTEGYEFDDFMGIEKPLMQF